MNGNKRRKGSHLMYYHIVDALLGGALVFFGAFSSGNISETSVIAALSASLIIALSKFKNFWKTQKYRYKNNLIFL